MGWYGPGFSSRGGTLIKAMGVLLALVGFSSWADEPAGFCEYTVDGAAPNRGAGGVANVMSLHWMAPTQKGRSIATPLLINCGTGAQLNFDTAGDSSLTDVPMAAKKYPISTKGKNGTFTARSKDFLGAEGELTISAWDTAHVAGSFSFKANGKTYAGRFDLKCPYPGNGVCR